MKEELKLYNIDIDNIEESNDLIGNLYEAIREMRKYTSKDKFEVILNNNLIDCKDKLTNFRTILGCRISYDNLDKNISFIVREDTKPTYEKLEKRINKAIEELENIPINANGGDILQSERNVYHILKGSDKE